MNQLPKREIFLLACALVIISFVVGMAAGTRLDRFPVVGEIVESVQSVYANLLLPRITEPWESNEYLYLPTRVSGEGVQRYAAGKAYPGYTLFSAAFEPAAYLVDMQGRRIHEWRLPFSAAWRSPPHIDMPVPDKFVHFRRMHVFPNGDLLTIYEAPDHWPYGYGLVKMDKDSKLLWAYADLVNHDFDIAPDGRIYTLAHQVRKNSDPELAGLNVPIVIDDALLILSPEGKMIERVSLLGAFIASPYAPLVRATAGKDILHTNSVQVVTPEIARIFPFVRPGQVLLSHNYKGAISVLDPGARTIVWARVISRDSQHTARFVQNGTIAVFKNWDNITYGGRSRIATVDPATGGETWAFSGNKSFIVESRTRGSVQPLPNGNMLVTDTDIGRLFEVTPEKEIVWEYLVGHAVHGKTPAIFDATRVDPAGLPFLARPDAPAQKP